LLAEGTKILYRVSLALLKLYESDLLGIDNAGDLINHLRQCTQKIHDRDRLMKVDSCASVPIVAPRLHNLALNPETFYHRDRLWKVFQLFSLCRKTRRWVDLQSYVSI
jgi:hypothetical protein